MRHALLIEDNVLLQSAIRQFLESIGYSTSCASSREEAITLVNLDFDVIVFDYVDSGEVSPRQFIQSLRSSSDNKATPIIVITGYTHLTEDLDVDAVLHKPFDVSVLETCLRRIMSTRSKP